MKLRIFVISFAVILLALPEPVASQTEQRLAQVEVGATEPAIMFHKDLGQIPEGVAMDNSGNLYVSLAPLGQIWKIDKDGVQTVIANIGTPPFPGPGALGLEVDLLGNVYVAVASFEADSQGVWRISPDGALTRLLPMDPASTWPNGLAFDELGDLYVTDSLDLKALSDTGTIVGRVWRIAPDGKAEIWSTDPLLAGVINPFTRPLGPNGIAYLRGKVLVANTTHRQIVQIPVLPDGSAGTAEVVANMDDFLVFENVPPFPPAVQVPPFLDGISVDSGGNIYAAVVGQHKLVRLPPDGGSLAVLADYGDDLELPASLAFGTTQGTRSTLFITNFVFRGGLDKAWVLKVDVGIPGAPVIGQPLLPVE